MHVSSAAPVLRRGSGCGPRRDSGGRRGKRGTLIRHASATTVAVAALTVAMIEATFKALLMASASSALRKKAGLMATGLAAVELAAIAAATDGEELVTEATTLLTKTRDHRTTRRRPRA